MSKIYLVNAKWVVDPWENYGSKTLGAFLTREDAMACIEHCHDQLCDLLCNELDYLESCTLEISEIDLIPSISINKIQLVEDEDDNLPRIVFPEDEG